MSIWHICQDKNMLIWHIFIHNKIKALKNQGLRIVKKCFQGLLGRLIKTVFDPDICFVAKYISNKRYEIA